MLVLVRPDLPVEELGALPPALELVALDGPPTPGQLARAEVVVPAYGSEIVARLGEMPALRLVLVSSAGYEWLTPHLPEGVAHANARGARDSAVAEWVLAAVLAMEKDLPGFSDAQRAERWAHRLVSDLAGRTALILGAGSIGGAVAERLGPFGVEVIRVARTPRAGVHGAVELPALLPRADVLVVLLPETPDTRGMVGAGVLGRLPEGALVVNAGRGTVVDTEALLDAVRSRGLRAALDVTDPEPLPPGHPLWRAPGVLITPHVAGDTPRAERAALRLAGDQLRAYAAGAPVPNVIGGGGSGLARRS
ncbi:MAG: 2-hydroxyacid dehydrogenase [Actinomycetota bacterium]|nr:2-hydroxyacid dehydrogenase [Actinomycetota bacterium]